MATLRRRSDSRDRPADAFGLAEVLDHGRPSDPDRYRAWGALAVDVHRALVGTRFDPRVPHMGRLTGRQLDAWDRDRRAWLAEYFKNDPRVMTDGK